MLCTLCLFCLFVGPVLVHLIPIPSHLSPQPQPHPRRHPRHPLSSSSSSSPAPATFTPPTPTPTPSWPWSSTPSAGCGLPDCTFAVLRPPLVPVPGTPFRLHLAACSHTLPLGPLFHQSTSSLPSRHRRLASITYRDTNDLSPPAQFEPSSFYYFGAILLSPIGFDPTFNPSTLLVNSLSTFSRRPCSISTLVGHGQFSIALPEEAKGNSGGTTAGIPT